MAGSFNITPHNPLESGPKPEINIKLHNNCDERTSIIIIHNDRPEFLNLCLQCIAVTSQNNNYEVIIVDNGSGTKTQNFLDELEQEGFKVIRNDENLYWSKAANQGAKAADKDSKYLVFMHHDVMVVNKNWLDIMVSVSQSSKSGLVGFNLKAYAMDNQKISFVHESCILVTRECWKDVGPFVEELPQEGSSFVFSFKATHKGYNPQVIKNDKNEFIHHWGIFALDFSDWERITEEASITMPKYIREIQQS